MREAQRVKVAIKKAGLTALQVAQMLGYHATSFSRKLAENPVDPQFLAACAAAIGVPVEYLKGEMELPDDWKKPDDLEREAAAKREIARLTEELERTKMLAENLAAALRALAEKNG